MILRMLLGLFWTTQGAYGQSGLLPSPPIQAAAAIVVDGNTGAVLWAKNPDKRLPPASTTKIVTGLLLARDVPPAQPVITSPNAAQTPGHALGMRPGETFRSHDLLYAILLASANDASVAAAEQIAQSEPAFAERMNRFARENHAPNTHFANASGLPASGHYSTARDLATLTRAALQNPDFAAAVRTRAYALPRSEGQPATPLVNENTLLGTVPGMDGVKAGWTQEAGACFVGSVTRHGQRLITVVLNSPDWKRETAALLEYGFGSLGTKGSATSRESAKNSVGPMRRAGATEHGVTGRSAGTNGATGVPAASHAPSASPASAASSSKAGSNRQRQTYIPAPPPTPDSAPISPPSEPDNGPGMLSGWHMPDGLLPARQASSTPFGSISTTPLSTTPLSRSPDSPGSVRPESDRIGSDRPGSDRRGRQGVTDRDAFSPLPSAPPGAAPSFLPYLLLIGLGLLAAALLFARKGKFTMPDLPFGLFGKRRKREEDARSTAAELAGAPIKRASAPPAAVPGFTFDAPLLQRLSGPEWLDLILNTPARLLEPMARRQACAIRDTEPGTGDQKILGLLNATSGRTRAVAAELLITHSPRQSEEGLLRLLKDEPMSAEVRAEAVSLLAQSGGDRHERLWLQMLLRDGSPPAAQALARLPRLEDTTVNALQSVLTTVVQPTFQTRLVGEPAPAQGNGTAAGGSDSDLKRNQRTAQIATVLLAQGHLTRPNASPFLNALPANHGEPIIIATLRGCQQKDAVECLVEIVLHGHAYPALQALLETDPRTVRQILDPLEAGLDLPAQTRATVLKWLVLGEGNNDAVKELAAAGNDLARGALQLARMNRWQPAAVPPDALLAAAQIYSLRQGFSLHAQEDIAYAFRKAATDGEARSLAALPPELQPLAEAYAHPDVYETVQVAMNTSDGLSTLLATLARHPDKPAYRQEMAFWCDKLPAATRLHLTHALCASEEAATDERTRAAIADRAADPDALVRGVALRWLHAHPEQKEPAKTEESTNFMNEH